SPGTLPAPGARFGRYEIIAELGHGGMGIVYRARDTQLDRDVALKIVRPDRVGTTDRFLREARAMAAVRHDHVVEIYDYGEDDGVTGPGAIVGTPAYMSPEQVNGLALDARSDLFSLGSVLYVAATGQAAFAASTSTATLMAIGEKTPSPARTVYPPVPVELSN